MSDSLAGDRSPPLDEESLVDLLNHRRTTVEYHDKLVRQAVAEIRSLRAARGGSPAPDEVICLCSTTLDGGGDPTDGCPLHGDPEDGGGSPAEADEDLAERLGDKLCEEYDLRISNSEAADIIAFVRAAASGSARPPQEDR